MGEKKTTGTRPTKNVGKKKTTMAKATISKVRKDKGGTDVTSLSKRRRKKKNEKMLGKAKWQQSCNREKKRPSRENSHPSEKSEQI